MQECPLCSSPGGDIIWEDAQCRVVRIGGAEGAAFPGYCRVVWHAHVAEMTELSVHDRRHVMNVVFAVETALRQWLAPDKINLAALGNMVPHLHWHIIPRWRDDSHFPNAIWAAAERSAVVVRRIPDNHELAGTIAAVLAEEEGGA